MKSESVASIYQRFEATQKGENQDQWIDVRQPEEWEEGVIPGAKKIMLSELEGHLDSLDKDAGYVMVCRSGGRSGRASQLMESHGFKDVTNFDGGMLAWYDAGHPTT